MSGPLEGVRIIELAGLGPAPFAGMMLSDAGADIIRIDAPTGPPTRPSGPPCRPHEPRPRSVAVDLKHPDGVALVLQLVDAADGLMEGFRPGVAERLGLGPEECLARNRKLVYGRMTGYGQDGPMAMAAGHDIDYIALSGALDAIGRAGDRPVHRSTWWGTSAAAACCWPTAWWPPSSAPAPPGRDRWSTPHGRRCGLADDHDLHLRSAGIWEDARGTNLLDTGAHFYEVYETSDGGTWASGPSSPSSTPS